MAQQPGRVTAAGAPAGQLGALADRINAILAEPALSHAEFGIRMRPRTGSRCMRSTMAACLLRRPTRSCSPPPRPMRLLPVDTLTWTTNVVASGEVDAGGTLHGDIVILGAGDPTLVRASIRISRPRRPPPPGTPARAAAAQTRPEPKCCNCWLSRWSSRGCAASKAAWWATTAIISMSRMALVGLGRSAVGLWRTGLGAQLQ